MPCNCNQGLAEDVTPVVATQTAAQQPSFLQRHEIDFKAPWSKNEKIVGVVGAGIIAGGLYLAFRKKKK